MFSFAAAAAEWLRRADRHRNTVLAALIAVTALEVAVGVTIAPVVFAALGAWLAAGLVVGRAMARVDAARAARLRFAIFCVDVIGIAVVLYVSGCVGLVGALPYVMAIALSAAAFGPRALAALTAFCAFAYGIPLFGEAAGVLRPYPLAGAAVPAPTMPQALVAWVTGAFLLAATALLMYQFVRLVRHGAEWHQLLVEQVPVMVGTLDETGRVTGANPAAHEGLGAAPGALVGRVVGDFFAEESRGAAAAHFVAVMAGASRRFTARIRRADGTRRWADVLAHPVREDGRVVHAVCLVRDVTEERAAAEALEQREARYRALLQHSSDVTSVVDAAGHLVYVSPSVERVFGQPATELAGRRWAPRRTPTTSPPCARRSPRWPPTRPRRCRCATACPTPTARGGRSRAWGATCSASRRCAATCSTRATSPSAPSSRRRSPGRRSTTRSPGCPTGRGSTTGSPPRSPAPRPTATPGAWRCSCSTSTGSRP
jgi:PAS domain S-box-containing protein